MSSHARSAHEGSPSALQPPVGHSVFATERPVVPREPHGDPGRRSTVAIRQIQAIRTLARIEDNVGEIEPPAGGGESFE
jgi:hypothetical protein